MLTDRILTAFLLAAAAWPALLAAQDTARMAELAGPGPEHRRLATLRGTWRVETDGPMAARDSGTATAGLIIGDRFLDLDGTMGKGATALASRYTIGFDRRHKVWTVTLIDTYGTYAVSGRGTEVGGVIRMAGEDDDPQMKQMGLRKKFVVTLTIEDPNRFTLGLWFVDTRTAAEKKTPRGHGAIRPDIVGAIWRSPCRLALPNSPSRSR